MYSHAEVLPILKSRAHNYFKSQCRISDPCHARWRWHNIL